MPRRQRSFILPASKEAPRRARRAICDAVGHANRLDEILLATSELVSNAVRHTDLKPDETIRLEVTSRACDIRVSVAHRGAMFSHDQDSSDEVRGYGLQIVDRIAKHWDVDQRGNQLETWFEIEDSCS